MLQKRRIIIEPYKKNLSKQERISLLKQSYFNWEKLAFGADIDTKEVPTPHEYKKLFEQSTAAYEFYRNWYYYYLKMLTDEHLIIDEFFDFAKEVKQHNSEDFLRTMEYFQENEDFLRMFRGQHQNSFELFPDVHQNEDVTQTLINLYQSKFENEAMLTILCVMVSIRNNESLNLQLTNFQDRSGNLIKGKIINYLLNNIEFFSNHPTLKEAISKGYNAQLRNLIGHNSFQLDNENKSIKKLNDDSIQMSYEEFYQCMYQLQELQNGIINFMAWAVIDEDELKGKGVVASGHGVTEDEEPILFLYRLHPFYFVEEDENDISVVLKLDSEYVYVFINGKINSFISLDQTISFFEKITQGKDVIVAFQYLIPAYDPQSYIATLDNGIIEDGELRFYLGDFHVYNEYEKTNIKIKVESLTTSENILIAKLKN